MAAKRSGARPGVVDGAVALKEPGMRDEPSDYEEALVYITERNNGWINSTAARVLVGEIVWLGRTVGDGKVRQRLKGRTP